MISNDYPSSSSGQGKLRPSPDRTLHFLQVQLERKAFEFALKENARGRFLRITERANGRTNSIVIPATGLEDFMRLIEDMGSATVR
jgi:hypothetical protein